MANTEKYLIAYLKNRIADLELDKASLYATLMDTKEEIEAIKKQEESKKEDGE